MQDSVSRRTFVGVALTAAATTAKAGPLPTRSFGRTSLELSILAIGCGNRLWAAYKTEDRGVEALRLAMESGINYFDTAQAYGDGISESWVGIATSGKRKEVILATKTPARTADDVMRRAEDSLKRLKTDYLDVLHIHSLKFEDDLAAIEKKGGALEGLYALRDQKVARYIGITSHVDPATLAKALERHDFDCTQMAINAGLQGRSPDGAGYWKKTKPGEKENYFAEAIPHTPAYGASFQEVALPVAVRKKLGIVAMKVTGQDSLIGSKKGKASATQLLHYALSLPVSIATIGMPQLEFIRENTAWARSFRPMPEQQRQQFSEQVAGANKLALDRRFLEHEDS